MKLDESKYQNYHTECSDNNPEKGIVTLSIGEALEDLKWMIKQCEINHKDPNKVPLFLNSRRGDFLNQWS